MSKSYLQSTNIIKYATTVPKHMTQERKLHLGCGKVILDGYINLDFKKLPGVDVVHNLEKKPYPFKDDTFDEVYGRHIVEHLDNLITVMEELHRIVRNDGTIKIIAPYFSGEGAFNDPTHKRFFTWKTFDYFAPGVYYSDAAVITLRRRIFFLSSKGFMQSSVMSLPFDMLINLAPKFYQRFLCYALPSVEVHYLLQVKK